MTMTEDTEVYTAIAKRILKTTGKNSSQDAAERLAQHMEAEALELADRASTFTEHADRKTIKEKDIEAALKET